MELNAKGFIAVKKLVSTKIISKNPLTPKIYVMHLVASIRPTVCNALLLKPLDLHYSEIWSKGEPLLVRGIGLYVCNHGAYADSVADAVDRLLIFLLPVLKYLVQ